MGLSLNERKKRNPVVSISRVTGMVLIILCHIIKYYHFIPGHAVLPQFFNCGVDLFLFISGYLYGERVINDFGKWYKKRVLLILLPASILSVIVSIALGIAGHMPTWKSIAAYIIGAEGLLFINWDFFDKVFQEISSLGHLWFVTIIMGCYLLIPLLQYVRAKTNQKASRIQLILVVLVLVILSIVIAPYANVSFFVVFIVGYIFGMKDWLTDIDSNRFLASSIVFVGITGGRILLHKFLDDSFLYSQYVSISQMITGVWIVVLFGFLDLKTPLLIHKIHNGKLFIVLEDNAFFIFLAHGVFCFGEFNVFEKTGTVVATLLFFVGTIILAVIIKKLWKIIIGQQGLHSR